jgi:hypothetical protein
MFQNASTELLFAGHHAFRSTPLIFASVKPSMSLRFPVYTFSRSFWTSRSTLVRSSLRCNNHSGVFPPVSYASWNISSVPRSFSRSTTNDLSGQSGLSPFTHFEDVRSMRYLYSRARRKSPYGPFESRRWLTGSSSTGKEIQSSKAATDKPVSPAETTNKSVPEPPHEKHLLDRLPEISHRFHRPTKEELLAAATGFWQRLRIRFKWLTIRSARPFNSDDISAFFSWIIVGHVIWILVGTTTFFSLLILAVNTVFAQG